MDYSSFIQLLNDEIHPDPEHPLRHIIRFRNRREFHSFLHQIANFKSNFQRLQYIQPLKIIHGFYCSLQSMKNIIQQPYILKVETDEKIKVHAIPQESHPIRALGSAVIPWGVQHIKAPKAWHKTMGENVRIAVIDTGVDFSHPDLQGVLGRGTNLINRFMFPYDDNGHGTHISGTIAAANFHSGMVGVAPRAQVFPVKAFFANGPQL